MPKFVSECGFVINLSGIPSEDSFKIISDKSVYEIAEAIDDGSITTGGYFDILEKQATEVYKCPQCCQLYVENEDGTFAVFPRKRGYGKGP